ncbi:MAG TPA: hypothetical protein VHZ07_06090 [Bryobacteraceae bacterium]|jgi:hypothetical protein|nr:hypothetical protein [Bryobacteraceae bacterium]
MPGIDNCAKVVPSHRFDKALHEQLHWLEDSIVDLIVRIACNPYDEAVVHLCQLRPPDDYETFAYRSPKGFELYWDVELCQAHLPRTAGHADPSHRVESSTTKHFWCLAEPPYLLKSLRGIGAKTTI